MLTEIQRDAIAKAKAGDYSLLDAMELDHRIAARECHHGFLLGGRLRLLALTRQDLSCEECNGAGAVDCTECAGRGDYECDTCGGDKTLDCLDCHGKGCANCKEGGVPCEDCEGAGRLDCEYCDGTGDVECDVCGGEGEIDFDCAVDRTITNLDGDVVYAGEFDEFPNDPALDAQPVFRDWAQKILTAYETQKREAAEAQAEAAKPPRAAAASGGGQSPAIHTIDFGV